MSSDAKMQQWFAQLSPRTAASRRFIEFCKTDVNTQWQQNGFNPRIYCESVLYMLKYLDRYPKADFEPEMVEEVRKTLGATEDQA